MDKIGQRIFVTKDNYGSPAVVIDYRDDNGKNAPLSHYKVRTDNGNEFWAFDFEIDWSVTDDRL